MNIVTIHQPEHLSYLGFFEKVSRCDTLVLLDSVNYEKNYFQNRNKIYTPNGPDYITVPVVAKTAKIVDMKINTANWASMRRKNLNKIEHSYKMSPFFSSYYDAFKQAYTLETDSLRDLNYNLLQFILQALGIEKQIIFSSEMEVSGAKSELLANICKKLGAKVYLAGGSGKDYLEYDYFEGIKVDIQHFNHPIYTQYGKTQFEPYMSVLDGLFNVGPEIMNIIKSAQGAK